MKFFFVAYLPSEINQYNQSDCCSILSSLFQLQKNDKKVSPITKSISTDMDKRWHFCAFPKGTMQCGLLFCNPWRCQVINKSCRLSTTTMGWRNNLKVGEWVVTTSSSAIHTSVTVTTRTAVALPTGFLFFSQCKKAGMRKERRPSPQFC